MRIIQTFYYGLSSMASLSVRLLIGARHTTFLALKLGLLSSVLLSCGSLEAPPSYGSGTDNRRPEPSTNSDSGSESDSGSSSDADSSSDSGSTEADSCSTPGRAGCPCEKAGATVDCGRIDYIDGDYVTCAAGTSRCDGTQWGPCTGNRIVAQNAQ